LTEHPDYQLERRQDGGFSLAPGDGEAIRVEPAKGGWRLAGPRALAGWELRRPPGEEGSYLLLAAGPDAEEAGRSTVAPGSEKPDGRRDLVMADGRVYRMLLRGPEDPRFELAGWETSGPYLTARPCGRGWSIVPEPASAGLDEIRGLLVLFAAEILDTGGPGPLVVNGSEHNAG